MPTNYANRFFTIAIVLSVALWCIFLGIFKGRLKPDLKPGIDMVGGTSLLYELKLPEGSAAANDDLHAKELEIINMIYCHVMSSAELVQIARLK